MESMGSFAHTKKVVSQLRDQASKLIDEMDGIDPSNTESGDTRMNRDGRYLREILEKIVEMTLKDKGKEGA